MKARAVVFLLAVMAVLIAFYASGLFAQKANTVKYMGLEYGRSQLQVSPGSPLYYTGQTCEGAKIYVPGWADRTGRAPPSIFLRYGDSYVAYLKPDRPGVYAYTLYGDYSSGESIVLRLVNECGINVTLMDTAPWEIEMKTKDGWKTVRHPGPEPGTLTLKNGTYMEWTWDQRLNTGKEAGYGDYMAVINGSYEVPFTISKSTPAVILEDTDYNQGSANDHFMNVPQHAAFDEAYKPALLGGSPQGDIVDRLLFKAYMKGADAGKLKSALDAANAYRSTDGMLPCLAVHARYQGRPAWFIVYNWGFPLEGYGHIRYFAVDDGTGQVVNFLTCK